MAFKQYPSVDRTKVAVFLWSATVYLVLKAMILDSALSLRLTARARAKPGRHITLPPELTDEIIYYLRGEQETLATCSLVCKAWLVASRYHLFRLVSLQIPVSKRRTEFLQSSIGILVPSTRYLHIQDVGLGSSTTPRAIDELIPLITPLIHVETLRLCNLDIRDFYPVAASVTSAFTMTRLELFDIIFQDVNEMTHFISHFTHLTRLDICPQFRHITPLAFPVYQLPTGVHSVGYTIGVSGEGSEVGDWISLSKEQIHSLDIGLYSAFVNDGYHTILTEFLGTLRPRLHHVNISFIGGQLKEGGPRHRDLKLSQNLESQSILVRLSGASEHRSLSDLLSLVPSPVTNIVINVLELQALYAEDWTKVDDLLDGPRFSELCDLSFHLPGPFYKEPSYETFLEGSLNKCYIKGILRVS